MTRSELMAKISQLHQDLEPGQIQEIVQKVLDDISQTLMKGGRVELRGFGSFSSKQRSGRLGRNPRTGEAIQIQNKLIVSFKSGKELRQLMNKSLP